MFRNSLKMLLTGGKANRKSRSSDGGSEDLADPRSPGLDPHLSHIGQGGSLDSDCAFEGDYAVPRISMTEGMQHIRIMEGVSRSLPSSPLLTHQTISVRLQPVKKLTADGSKIINGEKVPENKMLFMASVQNSRNQHYCGGFLINEDFVVTAAHCDDGNPTSVVLGTHNLKNIDDDTMRYSVKRCKHRCYEKVEEGSDIMLLKLSKKAQLNQRLQPISLPETETEITNIETCSVAGWGLTSVGKPDELQMVNVPIVDLDVCKNEWPNMLPENVICAGGYGTDKGFCQGDSGGPLVCNGKAAGVVSYNWRNNCIYPNRPNVYTEVSKYLPWIRKMMKDC